MTTFTYKAHNEKPFKKRVAAEQKANAVRAAGKEAREWAKRNGLEPTEQTVEVKELTDGSGYIVVETITKA